MTKRRIDGAIIVTAFLMAIVSAITMEGGIYRQLASTLFIGMALLFIIDFWWQGRKPKPKWRQYEQEKDRVGNPGEVVLLDENQKGIRSWSLSGKTALVIGRQNKDEDVDIDLTDCEYSALIGDQHAVLNYCLEHWYIEDLHSENGVQIQKVEDGICYKVSRGKPCALAAGDIIIIANTRLLIT